MCLYTDVDINVDVRESQNSWYPNDIPSLFKKTVPEVNSSFDPIFKSF